MIRHDDNYAVVGQDPEFASWFAYRIEDFGHKTRMSVAWHAGARAGYERGLLVGMAQGFVDAHRPSRAAGWAYGMLADWIKYCGPPGSYLWHVPEQLDVVMGDDASGMVRMTVRRADGSVLVESISTDSDLAALACLRECAAWADAKTLSNKDLPK